jgi:hypothetical protein
MEDWLSRGREGDEIGGLSMGSRLRRSGGYLCVVQTFRDEEEYRPRRAIKDSGVQCSLE